MSSVLDDTIPFSELQKYEKVYNEQLNAGCVSKSCQFEYGFCLVRSSYPVDVKKGIRLMEELCRQYPEDKRDCMYFLALGYARVKKFSDALELCRKFLQVEPGNQQVLSLQSAVKDKLKEEGQKGLLVAGGGLLALGAAVVAGVLVSKSIR